ncbi:MAG: 6,7-dimethyl-8-ribityllumazine synthase [Gammaproteobacteria bacterium]|nr:6,7-dimethyl-8-ribityllumazine synthase [Gammaproteobacteria bacterium]
MERISGSLIAPRDARVAIVSARFNSFIVDHLESGCIDILRRHGMSDGNIAVVKVPGAFELPVAVRRLALTGRYEAVVALGCVIRGSTAHFDYVAGTCANGLAAVATDTGIPVSFGVLTVDSIEQAIERAGTKAGNKGGDAGLTALEMINVCRAVQ